MKGAIHPYVKANFLASPPLVMAYALAGTTDIDLTSEPLGLGKDGRPVYLKDIWPTQAEIAAEYDKALNPTTFRKEYGGIEQSNPKWNEIPISTGALYAWDENSTYIQEPPFFIDMSAEPEPIRPIVNARVLVKVGDSVTTDHISPAGSIPVDMPAGQYLLERGVKKYEFNSFGSRRLQVQKVRAHAFGSFAAVTSVFYDFFNITQLKTSKSCLEKIKR